MAQQIATKQGFVRMCLSVCLCVCSFAVLELRGVIRTFNRFWRRALDTAHFAVKWMECRLHVHYDRFACSLDFHNEFFK